MNERIFELAKEAGFYANPDVEKFEKFAELIIKECMNACRNHEDVDQFDIHPLRVEWVTEACSENIKRHFGVEE